MLLVFYTARATGDPVPALPLEVHIYISGGFIVTVRRDACSTLDDLHGDLAPRSSDDEEMLVYRVLDALTDAFYPVIDAVEDEIDELEGEVLSRPAARAPRRSYRLKQYVRQLHRLVAAQRDQFQTARDAILGLEGLTTGARAPTCATSATTSSRSRASSSARPRT